MKNIINLVKYNLTYDKRSYITIGILVACLFLFSWIPAINFLITLVFLSMYLIRSFGVFIAQLTKEGGRLMFMVPIKGWEFMIAKYLEFIVVSLVGVLAFNLVLAREPFLFLGIIYSIVFLGIYVSLTSVTIVISSYLRKRWMAIVGGIIGCIILEGIYSTIYMLVKMVTPYVYLAVGGIKIDLIITTLGCVFYIVFLLIAIKHFDNKLEIN